VTESTQEPDPAGLSALQMPSEGLSGFTEQERHGIDRSYSSPPRSSSSKRSLLQKTQHNPEKIAIAKRLFHTTEDPGNLGNGKNTRLAENQNSRIQQIEFQERPKTGTPLKDDKVPQLSQEQNGVVRHIQIRHVKARDNTSETELLKQEIVKLAKGMQDLEQELQLEKKRKRTFTNIT